MVRILVAVLLATALAGCTTPADKAWWRALAGLPSMPGRFSFDWKIAGDPSVAPPQVFGVPLPTVFRHRAYLRKSRLWWPVRVRSRRLIWNSYDVIHRYRIPCIGRLPREARYPISRSPMHVCCKQALEPNSLGRRVPRQVDDG